MITKKLKTTAVIAMLGLGLAGCESLPDPLAAFPIQGNMLDSSKDKMNGMVEGARLTPGRHGRSNQAYAMSGTAHINLPAQILHNAEDFTITVWLKFKKVHPNEINSIISASNSVNADEFNLFYHSPDGFGITLQESVLLNSYSGNGVEDGRWHFLVFKREDDVGTFYVDNKKIDHTIKISDDPLRIDMSGLIVGQEKDVLNTKLNKDQSLSGSIDQLEFYGEALSDEQIYNLF